MSPASLYPSPSRDLSEARRLGSAWHPSWKANSHKAGHESSPVVHGQPFWEPGFALRLPFGARSGPLAPLGRNPIPGTLEGQEGP